jgi:DNA-binding response OmpR family regulator
MEPLSAVRRRLNVLLVDDSLEQRDFYECALEGEFGILTAARGWEGLTLALSDQPDAIILDVTMPGLDGWDTCTELKRNA